MECNQTGCGGGWARICIFVDSVIVSTGVREDNPFKFFIEHLLWRKHI